MENRMQTPYPNRKRQQGFTLLELLVVVSVLAALAGIAAVAVDGYEQEAQEQLVQVEMKRIANAIYRFKEDTGYFPKEGIFTADNLFGTSDSSPEKSEYEDFSNLSWLFSSPQLYDTNGDGDTDGSDSNSTNLLDWSVVTGRGWNGPYITTESQQRFLSSNCDLYPDDLSTLDVDSSIPAKSDTFERGKSYDPDNDECFILYDNGVWIPKEASGMPYRYDIEYYSAYHPDCIDNSNTCVALISAGKDSSFSASTDASGDDIVFVLREN